MACSALRPTTPHSASPKSLLLERLIEVLHQQSLRRLADDEGWFEPLLVETVTGWYRHLGRSNRAAGLPVVDSSPRGLRAKRWTGWPSAWSKIPPVKCWELTWCLPPSFSVAHDTPLCCFLVCWRPWTTPTWPLTSWIWPIFYFAKGTLSCTPPPKFNLGSAICSGESWPT